MRLLAIETSCDETSAAVVEKNEANQIEVLSNITTSSASLHAKTGGIIPESAAREQVRWIMPVIIDALISSADNKTMEQWSNEEKFRTSQKILKEKIDTIAVTHGPGLIGSLLVGVETAKTLSFALNKPLIPVNHLLAHLFANFIYDPKLDARRYQLDAFPFIGLIVSGGHTDLLYFESNTNFKWLGGTRDDAAGEALDKIGRLLGLPYPAGPEIEQLANKVSKTSLKFQSPLLHEDTFDFSFSGLKTEALRFIQKQAKISEDFKNEICAALQKAIFDVLVDKTLKAAQRYKTKSILLGGGVAANQKLKEEFISQLSTLNFQLSTPPAQYCTDNAAMIGAYALINYKPIGWKKINAEPELYFD